MSRILTRRLVLRPLCDADAEGYGQLLADPTVHPYVVDHGPVLAADVPARVQRKERERVEGTAYTWAVLESERFVGYVALHGLGRPRVAISYAILPSEQRRGFGKEAVRAIQSQAAALSFEEVEAQVHHGNEASVRLLLAAGFQESAAIKEPPRRVFLFRRPGEPHDPGLPELLFLPGLDGTGRLLEELVSRLPAGVRSTIVRYPRDRFLDYGELLDHIRDQAPARPHLVVAESFSGPLGVRYAATHPDGLRGLVMCATFVRNPLPPGTRWLRHFVGPWSFRGLLLRSTCRLYAGTRTDLARRIRDAVSSVAPHVLASRLREALTTDASDDVTRVQVPILYMAGARDRLIGPRGMDQLRSLRPEIRTARLATPHLVLQAAPDDAAQVILNFARELPDRTAAGEEP